MDEGFLQMKVAEANKQHKSIISALKAAALKWEFEQINFVVNNHASVVKSDIYTKIKKLDVQEGNKDKLFADHATQVCEAIVSFLQQVQGGMRPTTEGSRENICTCEEMGRGTHACKASKLGPVERCWTTDGKLGITIQDPPPESRRRTHLLYFTYSYCILSRV